MDRYQTYLERLYKTVQQDWDRIIPVVGEEGAGKSTLILQSIWLWNHIRGKEPTPDSTLRHVVFDDRDSFESALANSNPTDPIGVMDAAHVLHKKDAMNPEQKETEKTLLDIRIDNYVIFLGYQDWDDIPTQLQRRRAKNLIRIPSRGRLQGYNRSQLDEKYEASKRNWWPDPSLEDTFPDLEGTELWERFNELDRDRKETRLSGGSDDSDDAPGPKDVAEEIKDDGISHYLSVDKRNESLYVDDDIIGLEYEHLSVREARQVRKLLERDSDVARLIQEQDENAEASP